MRSTGRSAPRHAVATPKMIRPMMRKWVSGSDASRRPNSTARLIPDRRGPSPLHYGGGEPWAGRRSIADRIPRRPPARRVFQHTHVIEGALLGVEGGVCPQGPQFRVALEPGWLTVGQVDLGAIVRAAPRRAIQRQLIRAGDVEDPLL